MEERHEFQILDDGAANWAIKKIREIRREAKRQVDNLDREIARYQKEREDAIKQADNDAAYFEGQLSKYMLGLLDDKQVKCTKAGNATYKLPDGKIKYTGASEKYNHDDEKLLTALNDAGWNELIKVKAEPKWADVKKLLKTDAEGQVTIERVDPETGEIASIATSGISVEMMPAKITVEVAEG